MNDEDPAPSDEDASEEEASSSETSSGFSESDWWLLVIPVLALATFVLVLLYGASILHPSSIHPDASLVHVVIVGAVVLVALLIVEGVLLAGGHPEHLEDEEEPAPGPERPAAREDIPTEEDAEEGDLEALSTDDEVEGRKVLELARPPKTAVDAGVYSTTYVEIDRESVLRVEELVAERA